MNTIEESFVPFPILETERTRLRPITPKDLRDIYEYCSVPEVSQYTMWNTHQSLEDTRRFVEFVLHRYAKLKVGPWGIEHKESGTLIGTCSFIDWDNRNQKAELGYVLSNVYWNHGLMTEVIRRVIQFGFDKLQLVRIEAKCHPDNIGSFKVMEKTGMELEGRLRNYLKVKDRYEDILVYSIVKSQ
ncbi:GNAT family N-acetyltransferase [Paenibacillus sp. JCM 10914]|uniref:GNAT family N-acetyltransferase n=1 Tax=Paenibacillus sp. JCM 10914 TaxID=1236974 RepID=UPI0003CC80B4|nr:GNAT family N-acetyltransferase [Paenibacillus sp. JCM 10914]GAE06928.1 acetyltransferase, including N-acetylase of ribosomal proteins [Paenibacillus sp. JCM 10914]